MGDGLRVSWDAAAGVLAGMPSVELTDFAATRLEIISMFLVGILLSAFVVQGVWNGLRTEFSTLPQLTYRRALGVVFLWGLLFVIVLTMISGARELMTPGAWIKKGNTYDLTPPKDAPPALPPIETYTGERRERMARLGDHLRALVNDAGGLPLERGVAVGERAELWEIPQAFGFEYIYFPAVRKEPDPAVWIAEPEFFADGRFVLKSDGTIELVPPGSPLPEAMPETQE